jgi:energy-coupling factor transporter ATP-binding protein EcfA2
MSSIERIIRDRQDHARNTFSPLSESLCSMISALCELERQGREIMPKISNINDSAKLRAIDDIAKYRVVLQEQAKEISDLVERFNRKTLNIGVLGDTGRGKSTLLETISGIDPKFLPTGGGRACTVARSTIRNGSTTKVKVVFHSEQSFAEEIIKPFYEKLGFSVLSVSIRSWITSPLPELSEVFKKDITKVNIHHHLDSFYKKYARNYQDKLKGNDLKIQPEDISKYVSHIFDEEGNLTNPECLAVKEVQITQPFRNPDVGLITLVDMPGLGTFRAADEELMIQTLGNMVDVALFLLRPAARAEISPSDTELYNKVKQNLGFAERRTYIVLNKDNGNLNNCKIIKARIQNSENSGYKLSCVDALIADCKAYEDVDSEVIKVVLKYLELEITKLDKQYAKETIEETKKNLDLLKASLTKVRLPYGESDSINEFLDTFLGKNGFIANLAQALGEQLFELARNSESHKKEFKQAVSTAIKNCREGKAEGIPTEQEVRKEIFAKGGKVARLAEYQEEIRAYISKYFIELDFNLQEHLENIKGETVRKLKSIGLENFGAEYEGSSFLKNFLEYFPEDKMDRMKGLHSAFKRLSEYNVSYSGIISHRIRQKVLRRINPLNSLNRSSNNSIAEKTSSAFNYPVQLPSNIIGQINQILDELESTNSDDLEKKHLSQVEAILSELSDLYDWAINECEKELMDIYVVPNEVAYSMIEEFSDYITRSKNYISEWKTFLNENLNIFMPPSEDENLKIDWKKSLNLVEQEIKKLELHINQALDH